jgi:hypothetical protein
MPNEKLMSVKEIHTNFTPIHYRERETAPFLFNKNPFFQLMKQAFKLFRICDWNGADTPICITRAYLQVAKGHGRSYSKVIIYVHACLPPWLSSYVMEKYMLVVDTNLRSSK